MVVGIDKLEVKDPDTAETLEYRSPMYYLWLAPIKRSLGSDEAPPRTEPPEKISPQRPGEAPVKRPGLPTAPPTRPLAPGQLLPPAPEPVEPPVQQPPAPIRPPPAPPAVPQPVRSTK
jgi:hypothetical protein